MSGEGAEEEQSGGGPGVDEGEDVGVLELGRDLDLAQESLRTQRRGQLRPENLDRDPPVMLEVFGEKHERRAARPELALDAIAVREGGGDPRENWVHPGPCQGTTQATGCPGSVLGRRRF